MASQERNQASSILQRVPVCYKTWLLDNSYQTHTHTHTHNTRACTRTRTHTHMHVLNCIHTHVNRELILQTQGKYRQLAYISQMKYALALYIITTCMHYAETYHRQLNLGTKFLHRWCIGDHFAVGTAVLHYDLFGMVASYLSINGYLTSKLWTVTIQYENAIKSTAMYL